MLTTHRRESFGQTMRENLAVLRRFVETRPDVALIFPVHPNPSVVESARQVLTAHPRIHLLEPLGYEDFIPLLSRGWLIVSDSGGVQEEAPSLGRPLLILRENTERPEAVQSGVARLVGGDPSGSPPCLKSSTPIRRGSSPSAASRTRSARATAARESCQPGRLLGVNEPGITFEAGSAA